MDSMPHRAKHLIGVDRGKAHLWSNVEEGRIAGKLPPRSEVSAFTN